MKKFFVAALYILFILPVIAYAGEYGLNGDINNDDKIALDDAIFALQIVAGIKKIMASDQTEPLTTTTSLITETSITEKPITTWYKDADGDGFSDGSKISSVTRPSDVYYKADDLIATAGDLNDNNIDIHPESIKFSYALPSVKHKITTGYDGSEQTVINTDTQKSIHIGKPILPIIPVNIVLPDGHELDHLEVTGEKIELQGTYIIEHGQQPYPLLPDVTPMPTPLDSIVYSSDEPYPGVLYDVVGVQKLFGISILVVNLNPVEYRPESGRISYYKNLSVNVITNPVRDNKRQRSHFIRSKPSQVPLYLKVENPETLSTYSDNSGENRLRSIESKLCAPADTYQYVIITGESIKDSSTNPNVNDLISHRQTQGFSATVVSVEDIYSSYPGNDQAEQIRNFIIDAYNNWETEFILLGGDTNIVPMRKLWCKSWRVNGYTEEIPSDLYYQCLDGNYNSDGDDKWGEPNDGDRLGDVDLIAELHVGRASAENETEMANFIYKTITYENDTSAYKNSVLMVGEYLGFGGISEYAKGSLDEIKNGSSNHEYTTAGFSDDYNINTLYAKDEEWSKSAIINKINLDTYSIINHLGHANYNYVMKFFNTDAGNLTNSKFLFAYSQGCIPGNFERDCIAEHLTTSTRSGMFAVVFNSRYGWGMPNSTDGPSQRYNREFWNAFFGDNNLHLGKMNTYSHQKNLWRINEPCMRWCYYELNLLGDPATSLSYEGPNVNGGFGSGGNWTWNSGTRKIADDAKSVFLSDVNGDGNIDLVAVGGTTDSGRVYVAISKYDGPNFNGAFGSGGSWTWNSGTRKIADDTKSNFSST